MVSIGTSFVFSADKSIPNRVCNVVLELMNFTLTISTDDGSTYILTDQDEVQSTLNHAHQYNQQIVQSQQSITVHDQGDRIFLKVELDPVNKINTFTCSI